jgi:hypothetical protein
MVRRGEIALLDLGVRSLMEAPMAGSSFVGYFGEAEFHDGSVLAVEHRAATARVRVRGVGGTVFVVEFAGVRAMRAARPERMLLYALSEWSAEPPLRRFTFTNWDDDSEACLEVDAETVTVHEE